MNYKELYKEHLTGVKVEDLSKKYKISVGNIRYNWKKLDLKGSNRKYTFNEKYFDVIDTPNKAYILGFLHADGYVDSTGRIGWNIVADDSDILEFIKDELEYDKEIIYKEPNVRIVDDREYVCRLQAVLKFYSKYMVNSLAQYTITPNKTFTCELPNIDPFLIPHFLRGSFDGDGGILKSLANKKTMNYIYGFMLCGNPTYIEQVRKYLMDNGIKTHYIKNGNIGYIRTRSQKELLSLYYLLDIENQFSLPRKKSKWEEFLKVKFNKQ